jgi:hypothetical protein
MPLLGPTRDRRESRDLGVRELERPGLTEEHLGSRGSKGHGARTGSGARSRLRREGRGCGGGGDE